MKIKNHNMIVGELQEIPLVDRLSKSRGMISLMCSEHRPPKMSIPVEWYDEDFYINQTLLDVESELDTLQARLTLTEAALSAAGELLGYEDEVTERNGVLLWCDYCNRHEKHDEDCPYRQAKERYHAAREALNGDETK